MGSLAPLGETCTSLIKVDRNCMCESLGRSQLPPLHSSTKMPGVTEGMNLTQFPQLFYQHRLSYNEFASLLKPISVAVKACSLAANAEDSHVGSHAVSCYAAAFTISSLLKTVVVGTFPAQQQWLATFSLLFIVCQALAGAQYSTSTAASFFAQNHSLEHSLEFSTAGPAPLPMG